MSSEVAGNRVAAARVEHNCFVCGGVILAGSPYRHFSPRDMGRLDWHDDCPAPEVAQVAAEKARLAAERERQRQERDAAWQKRSMAVRDRLNALGVIHSLIPPYYVRIGLDGIERLLDLLEKDAAHET